jgi:hypothetical protein
MGKFLSGTLFGIGAASAVTWLTRRLDFVMVQDQMKQQIQARWDREAIDRALVNARAVVVNVRPRRRSSEPKDDSRLDGTESSAPEGNLESPTIV